MEIKRVMWVTYAQGGILTVVFDSGLFTLLVVDADDHGKGGSEGDDARDGAGPRALALLDFHPTVHVVTWIKNEDITLITR